VFARRSRTPRLLALAAATIVVLLAGVWLGGHPGWIPSSVRSAFVDESANAKLVDQVVAMLQQDYYRKVNGSQLVNDGLAAAVASLGDPYSHYFNPSDYRSFQSQSDPHLSGIGVSVEPAKNGLQIVEVFDGSPAARAGLSRGDVITRVGATPLAGRSANFSGGMIRGRAGTTVTLTVISGKRHRVVSVKRADIVEPVATGRVVSFHGVRVGYVQLTSFTQGSGAELRARVEKVLRGGARALVLDLRENGGGLLDEAVKVASIFIPDGTIVSTSGRSQPRQVFLAKGGAISATIPVVVLVDHGTASSSEIVTGALQDRHRAKVVGTHTYGKGVFQEIQPLPNGGALDMTVGEYFTPSGRNLGGGGVRRGAGITPDVFAATNPRSRVDTALRTAEQTVVAELR
jgi:carboxyl-terminal processing protease